MGCLASPIVQGNGLFSCARRRSQVLAKYRSSCNNSAVKAPPAFEVVSFADRCWFPALLDTLDTLDTLDMPTDDKPCRDADRADPAGNERAPPPAGVRRPT